MTTTTIDRASASDLKGQVLAEAAKRMLPVLAAKLLAAAADRAEASIDALSDRLGDMAENGGSRRERPASDAAPATQSGGGGMLSTILTMTMQQARVFLDLVVRLLAQAAAAARTAAERLRARRAPEGIDEEPADDDVLEGEYEEEFEDEDERATAAV